MFLILGQPYINIYKQLIKKKTNSKILITRGSRVRKRSQKHSHTKKTRKKKPKPPRPPLSHPKKTNTFLHTHRHTHRHRDGPVSQSLAAHGFFSANLSLQLPLFLSIPYSLPFPPQNHRYKTTTATTLLSSFSSPQHRLFFCRFSFS